MSMVRINLIQGKSPDYRAATDEVVYRAILETLNVHHRGRRGMVVDD
jgi:hypothetical protein